MYFFFSNVFLLNVRQSARFFLARRRRKLIFAKETQLTHSTREIHVVSVSVMQYRMTFIKYRDRII